MKIERVLIILKTVRALSVIQGKATRASVASNIKSFSKSTVYRYCARLHQLDLIERTNEGLKGYYEIELNEHSYDFIEACKELI